MLVLRLAQLIIWLTVVKLYRPTYQVVARAAVIVYASHAPIRAGTPLHQLQRLAEHRSADQTAECCGKIDSSGSFKVFE